MIQPEDSYSRTLLVYLAGDNNLSYETDEKIESMVKGWSGEGGNLIIYQDKSNTVPQLLEVYRDNGVNYTQVIQTYEEENSADPTVLARIVGEVVRLYPADSYGLIFFFACFRVVAVSHVDSSPFYGYGWRYGDGIIGLCRSSSRTCF